MRPFVFLVILLCAGVACAQHVKGPAPKAAGESFKAAAHRAGVDWCATQEKFEKRYPGRGKDASCREGDCDNPVLRNVHIPGGTAPLKTFRLFLHVFRETDGTDPLATEADIAAQVLQLNNDFAPSRIRFVYEWRYVSDSTYLLMTGLEEEDMKERYALSPDTQLNVFLVQVLAGFSGQGTFPWDSVALEAQGGIIMDANAFGAGQKTLTHEVGHNLGLWHTHHGVTEVEACSACYERANGADAENSGDFCADTAPTPVNFECGGPGGNDNCSATVWGGTDPQNYMGYAPDDCLDEFSSHQMGRMHCWSDGLLRGWYTQPGDARVVLDRDTYNCSAMVGIELSDADLSGDGSASVSISSSSGDVETVVLTETNGGEFAGSIPLGADGGMLTATDGDTIIASYGDATNAANLPEVVTDGAAMDCAAPEISDVQVRFVADTIAQITFSTDGNANGRVRLGTGCGSTTDSTPGPVRTEHGITLGGLSPNTTYRFQAVAQDAAGNTGVEDNSGACYEFTTLGAYDFLTEEFTTTPDLQFVSLTYTPDGSPGGYRLCVEPISALPTDYTGGALTALSDDGSAAVTLTGGHSVPFHGQDYNIFWINANGNITFDASDLNWEGTVPLHMSRPRVSAIFVDLNLVHGGKLYRQEMADRYVATWVDVPEYGQADRNTFQIELFYDGVIRVSYLVIQADFGVAGLSVGPGEISLPHYSDLSSYGECLIDPYIAGASFVEAGTDVTLRVVHAGLAEPVAFQWSKDGEPIGGSTDTLALPSVMESHAGRYRAVLFDGSKATYVTPPFQLHVAPVGMLPAAGGYGVLVLAGMMAAIIAWRNRNK